MVVDFYNNETNELICRNSWGNTVFKHIIVSADD